MRTLVTDEPDLGLVRWSPDGSRLLLASTRGLEADDPAADQRRWDVLRERVSDWDPRPHLHVVDRASGLRRVLTRPGDFALDDAAWLPGGERVVYARTVPQVPRPWFRTELRVVDLASGEDRLAATFTAGWEVRPQALTPHPDGRRVLFVGPPDEVGGEREEHNVYNKQLWLLDLETGRVDRITRGLPHAFAGARGLPAWTDDDRLLASAVSGSGETLVRLERDGDRWRATELPHRGRGGGNLGAGARRPGRGLRRERPGEPARPLAAAHRRSRAAARAPRPRSGGPLRARQGRRRLVHRAGRRRHRGLVVPSPVGPATERRRSSSTTTGAPCPPGASSTPRTSSGRPAATRCW